MQSATLWTHSSHLLLSSGHCILSLSFEYAKFILSLDLCHFSSSIRTFLIHSFAWLPFHYFGFRSKKPSCRKLLWSSCDNNIVLTTSAKIFTPLSRFNFVITFVTSIIWNHLTCKCIVVLDILTILWVQ